MERKRKWEKTYPCQDRIMFVTIFTVVYKKYNWNNDKIKIKYSNPSVTPSIDTTFGT